MRAVNLLPAQYRSGSRAGRSASGTPAAGGAGPFLVLGALALCLLAVAAYVLAANTVTERQAELARVSAAHEAAARRAAALKPYGDFQDMAIRRTETVSSLAALRFDWEQGLRDVSHALPSTVTLTSLDGSISTDTGASSTQLRGEIPAPAITMKGCTRTQSAVASMMSRLRAVRGATRVTLSRSERVAAASTVSAAAGPCGNGKTPQFEVVVFFERSGAGAGSQAALAAAAAGGTAAVGAPTTTSAASPAASPSPGGSASPTSASASPSPAGTASAPSAPPTSATSKP